MSESWIFLHFSALHNSKQHWTCETVFEGTSCSTWLGICLYASVHKTRERWHWKQGHFYPLPPHPVHTARNTDEVLPTYHSNWGEDENRYGSIHGVVYPENSRESLSKPMNYLSILTLFTCTVWFICMHVIHFRQALRNTYYLIVNLGT